jgi:hypothetical protein
MIKKSIPEQGSEECGNGCLKCLINVILLATNMP